MGLKHVAMVSRKKKNTKG